jgi:acyl-CoA synthetase (AMP-forming)/AMP-acid ligase II
MTPDVGLANWFLQRSLRTPERLALRFEGESWTYGQMQRCIENCAARLRALGVAKGDRVAFLGLNQPMFLFSMFATLRLGAIFVPLNFRLTGPELAFMINDSAATVLIVANRGHDTTALQAYLGIATSSIRCATPSCRRCASRISGESEHFPGSLTLP